MLQNTADCAAGPGSSKVDGEHGRQLPRPLVAATSGKPLEPARETEGTEAVAGGEKAARGEAVRAGGISAILGHCGELAAEAAAEPSKLASETAAEPSKLASEAAAEPSKLAS